MPDMAWKPDVTVAAVTERDGRFLLVEERASGRIVINQPAGHLEPGETFADAVVRETLEETGWTFRPQAIVGVYVWQPDGAARTFLRIAYSGVLEAHDADRPLDRGIVRTRWCVRDQLIAQQARLRSPLVLRCIDDYLAGARYPLDLVSHVLRSGPAGRLAAG